MKSSIPRISVLMAVFNTPENYLEMAVNSILAQSFADFEFLIVDDGSNALTKNKLEELASNDLRIRLLRLSKNKGLTVALNYGLKKARGEYIARQDADDISAPDRFSISLAYLDSNLSLAAAGTYVQQIGSKGELIAISHIQPDLSQLCRRNVLIHGSMFFRKKSLEMINGYNEKFKLSQDYELYLRMIKIHRLQIGVIPNQLYALRYHADSISSRRIFKQLYFSVLAKFLTLPQINGRTSRLHFWGFFFIDIVITHRLLLSPILRNLLNFFKTIK